MLFAGVASLPQGPSKELLARARARARRGVGAGAGTGAGGMGGGGGGGGGEVVGREGPGGAFWLPSCRELLVPQVARWALQQAMRFSRERLVHAKKKTPDYVRVQAGATPGVHLFLRFLAEEA